jgi:hypothetical protein
VALTYPLTDKAKQLQQKWTSIKGSAPPALLMDGYNIGEMLVRGATDAGTVEDTAAVNNALHRISFANTIFGKACWHEVKGIKNAMMEALAITTIKDGKEVLLDVAQPVCH